MNLCMQTDLAREAYIRHGEMEGVTEKIRKVENVTVSTVHIREAAAAQALGKRIGCYVTIETEGEARDGEETILRCIQESVSAMLVRDYRHVLVVGLGNRMITPDALGPRTAERIFVTRHIASYVPELALPNTRIVSAITPGVLGVTGLETMEIVRGVVRSVRPDALLCIDALAADSVRHIGKTVQLNDNGLLPGAGVNNRQKEMHAAALGLPVFAIGVPTVVSAASIAGETARLMAAESGDEAGADAFKALAEQSANAHMGELIVTPKDVDKLIDGAAKRLAEGINRALHGEQFEEYKALLST